MQASHAIISSCHLLIYIFLSGTELSSEPNLHWIVFPSKILLLAPRNSSTPIRYWCLFLTTTTNEQSINITNWIVSSGIIFLQIAHWRRCWNESNVPKMMLFLLLPGNIIKGNFPLNHFLTTICRLNDRPYRCTTSATNRLYIDVANETTWILSELKFAWSASSASCTRPCQNIVQVKPGTWIKSVEQSDKSCGWADETVVFISV